MFVIITFLLFLVIFDYSEHNFEISNPSMILMSYSPGFNRDIILFFFKKRSRYDCKLHDSMCDYFRFTVVEFYETSSRRSYARPIFELSRFLENPHRLIIFYFHRLKNFFKARIRIET